MLPSQLCPLLGHPEPRGRPVSEVQVSLLWPPCPSLPARVSPSPLCSRRPLHGPLPSPPPSPPHLALPASSLCLAPFQPSRLWTRAVIMSHSNNLPETKIGKLLSCFNPSGECCTLARASKLHSWPASPPPPASLLCLPGPHARAHWFLAAPPVPSLFLPRVWHGGSVSLLLCSPPHKPPSFRFPFGLVRWGCVFWISEGCV